MATQKKFVVKNGLIASGLTYPTADGTAGQSIVTDAAGNLSFGTSSAAETLIFTVKNRTGSTLVKGTVVYVSGLNGNTPEVSPARANSSSTMPAFGLVTADILDTEDGTVATFGTLTGLNVSNFGETGITFALRDTVYISASEAGKLTNVAPTGESNFIQNIGKIERATPTTNMTIKVGGAGRSNATPALNDGNIFIGDSNNATTTITLNTTNVPEGTNLYYTTARFDSDFSDNTTSDLTEGTNLYYTDARFDTRLATKSTTNLSEGTNLYYTDARADARVNLQTGSNLDLSSKSTTDLSEGSNLYYTTARFDSDFGDNNTDDLTEGSTNLYYTNARADARVNLQTGSNLDLSSKSTSDLSEGTNLYYTTTRGDSDTASYISGNRTYGNITTTGYLAGPATFTIDPAAVGDNTGTVVIAGNLQVDGTTTTINSTTLTVDDLNITLASGAANAAAANGAGITVDTANASITYDATNDEWDFNKSINVTGNITVSGTVDGVDLANVLVDGDFVTAGLMTTNGSGTYSITTNNSTNWNTAYGWGDHSTAGYLTSQTSHADVVVDGDFTSQGIMLRGASAGSYSILTDNSTNWNTAYGWGDHSTAGYLTSETFTSLVQDTSPQLGGTLDTNGNLIQFGDSGSATDNRLQFGASQDLEIYHDGSHTRVVKSGDGKLIISSGSSNNIDINAGTGGNTIELIASTGQVRLYYGGLNKLQTESTGITVSGNIAVSGTVDGVDIATNIPSTLGTAGQVLTVNSGGTAGEWADAAGVDLYDANDVSSTAPSASGNNAVAIGDNASASSSYSVAIGRNSVASTGDFAFAVGNFTDATSTGANAFGYQAQAVTNAYATAIARSYASGADSFAAAIANNTSSYGATGSYAVAMGIQAKAYSTNSIGIGSSTQAGNQAVAIGVSNTATSTQSTAIGYANQSSANNAFAFGSQAKSDTKGKIAYAVGLFSAKGDAQGGTFILRSDTTDATAEALTTDNSTASTDNQIILPNNSAYSFSGTIIARESATDGSDYASWEIKGALLRDANAASTVLGNGIVNKLYATSGASAWAVALSADTTNGGLKVEVTGAAATNIRWVATVNTSEVTYA